MVNSRRKGAEAEREFSRFCKEKGYDCRRGQQYSGIGGDDVVGLPGIHIEVKRVEKLNIHNAMEQSIRDSKGNVPIVAHRRSREEWLITMKAEDWFNMFQKWWEAEKSEVL